jgi:hypothetical protein
MEFETTDQIYDAMNDERTNYTALNTLQPAIDDEQTLLNDLTTPSRVAQWRLAFWIISHGIWQMVNRVKQYLSDIENKIQTAPPGSPAWLQQKVLEFQWDAATPQIVQAFPYVAYPVVDESMRLITQCAVVTIPVGGYRVKIASNLAPISTPQLDALKSYLSQINFGVPYNVVNANADFLMLGYDIYYDGQYSSVIQQRVADAINTFMSDFNTKNFNGVVLLSKLQDIIKAVDGVVDVVAKQVEARPYTIAASGATKLVDDYDVLLKQYSTYAGYFQIDTDTGRTLADTLSFIVA